MRELKAALAALGSDPEMVEVPLLQFVHLVESGERTAMSKRRGDFVTLDDLLDEIGVDATRFFMLQRSHDRTTRARPRRLRAPSRARTPSTTSSTLMRGSPRCSPSSAPRASTQRSRRVPTGAPPTAYELHPSERTLIKKLLSLPEEIDRRGADQRAPHRIAAYALELAQDFTAFYRDCHVVGASRRGSSRSASRCASPRSACWRSCSVCSA